jgi:hypothetical protein
LVSVNQTCEAYVKMGRTMPTNILLHERRENPRIELPKTPKARTVDRALLAIVQTCNVQSRDGVKKTPRYRIQVARFTMKDERPSDTEIASTWAPLRLAEMRFL